MHLIRTYNEYIKIDLVNDLIYSIVRYNIVDIAYSFDHEHALFSRIYKLTAGLVFQYIVRILNSHRQMVAQLASTSKQLNMTNM